MEKSAEAFRTIAEVAETLGVAPHVLRFWEQRFTQVAPVKRAGGRRYYRPADVALLAGLKAMLHDEGLTIRGAQKRLAEDGLAAVQARGGDWLTAQGAAWAPAARRAAAPKRRAAPKAAKPARPAQTAAESPAEIPAAIPAELQTEIGTETAAPRTPPHHDSPQAAPQPVAPAEAAEAPEAPEAPRRHPRRPVEPTATLPLFPELEPTPELPPHPAPAAVAAPRATTEAAPRYADPMAERLARLTAALRRCDALAGDAPLAPDLADDLATLARDLRKLADQAATLTAASA